MKRGTPEHPKTLDLEARLGVESWGACGILEKLWHWTAKYAPAGDIGKFSDAAIAAGIGWKRDPKVLIDALIACRWVDVCAHNRRTVHDWRAHAEDAVHMRLYRSAEYFCDGTKPKASRIEEKERTAIEKIYASKPFVQKEIQSVRTESAREAHAVRPALASALALALPVPEPLTSCANFQTAENLPQGSSDSKTKTMKKKKELVQKNGYNAIPIWCDKLALGCRIPKATVDGQECGLLGKIGNMYSEREFLAMLKAYAQDRREKNMPWAVADFYRNRNFWRSKARVGEDPNSEAALNAMMAKFEGSHANSTNGFNSGNQTSNQRPDESSGRIPG